MWRQPSPADALDLVPSYDIYNQLDSMTKPNGSLPPYLLHFGYSVGGERVWKRYRYCWQDTCTNDTGVIIPEDPEGMMMLPEDSETVEDGLLLGLDGMQTMGFTPPGGGEPSYCAFYDTVLTWYIVSNGKVLAEYDGLTKALHYKYIYAGDQRVAMRDGVDRLHSYLNDHLGSARVVIDSTGTIKDKYHYLAFGSPLDMTTSTGQPNKYTGKPYDMDAGMNLYYYGARYYDAELGRFTQVDPLRNKYPAWSPYSYTLDNPIRLVDPDGHRVWFTSGRELNAIGPSPDPMEEKARSDAAKVYQTPEGKAVLDYLYNNPFNNMLDVHGYRGLEGGRFIVGDWEKAKMPGAGSYGTAQYDPEGNAFGTTAFYHELLHMMHANLGTTAEGKDEMTGLKTEEVETVRQDNVARFQLKIDIQRYYWDRDRKQWIDLIDYYPKKPYLPPPTRNDKIEEQLKEDQ